MKVTRRADLKRIESIAALEAFESSRGGCFMLQAGLPRGPDEFLFFRIEQKPRSPVGR